jgi:replicative DNA helicase
MHNLCRDDYYHKILTKTADYSKEFYDKKLLTAQGRAFPTCLAFKSAGYCPQEKVCFEKRPPLIERFGKFEEDKKLPEDQWREPTPVQWVFQSIKERTGAEEETETAVIDVDVRNLEESLDELEKEILEKRNVLMKNRRTFCGYDTGFNLLNQVLDGLKADTLLTLSGPTGVGKTIFCSQLIEQICQIENIPCLFLSFGESKNRIIIKTLARMATIDYRKIGRSLLSEEDLGKIKQLHEKIKGSFGKNLFIVEGNDSMGVKKIREILDFSNPACIVIDSVQSIPQIGRTTAPDIVSKTEMVVQQLKTLSRYKKIPVVTTFSTKDKDATSEAMETVMLNTSDVYIHMFEKITSSGMADAGAAMKEINFHIKKNRSGDKNIVIKYALQPLLQKFTESK